MNYCCYCCCCLCRGIAVGEVSLLCRYAMLSHTRWKLTDLPLIQLQLLSIGRQRLEHLHKLVERAARFQRPPATTIARHRRAQGRRGAPGQRSLRGCFFFTLIVLPPFPCHGCAALRVVFESGIIISRFLFSHTFFQFFFFWSHAQRRGRRTRPGQHRSATVSVGG